MIWKNSDSMCRYDNGFGFQTLTSSIAALIPRNVCISKTPVYSEEILPSNWKKSKCLFTLCHRAIDIVEKQKEEVIAVIWNGELLFPLLKIYSLIFLDRPKASNSYKSHLRFLTSTVSFEGIVVTKYWSHSILVTITQPGSISLNIWTIPLFIGFYFSRQHLTALWLLRSHWANLWSEATAWNEFVTSVKQWIIMNNDGCFSSSQILYFDVSVTKSERIVIDALFRQMLIHYQKHLRSKIKNSKLYISFLNRFRKQCPLLNSS